MSTPSPIHAAWEIQTGAWALREAEARFQTPTAEMASVTKATCQGKCAKSRRCGVAESETSSATVVTSLLLAELRRRRRRRGRRHRLRHGHRR